MKADDGERDASAAESGTTGDKTSESAGVLLGVKRVGPFDKHLTLNGDHAEVVVLCADKPVTSLLHRIATLMAKEIEVTLLHPVLELFKNS